MTPTIQELIDQLKLAKAQRDAAIAFCRELIHEWVDDDSGYTHPAVKVDLERIEAIEKMELPKPRFYVTECAGALFWDIVDRDTKQIIDYTRQAADPTGERAQEIADQHNNDPFELSA